MEFNNFLSGKQNGKAPQDALQALDIIMREMPSLYYTPVGQSFFPCDGPGRSLGEGCEVQFGFYSSVRHSKWNAMLLNIDGKLDDDFVEAEWPHGQCIHLQIEWSGFESWPGTLCCVLGKNTLLSQCLAVLRCING